MCEHYILSKPDVTWIFHSFNATIMLILVYRVCLLCPCSYTITKVKMLCKAVHARLQFALYFFKCLGVLHFISLYVH